MSADGLAKVMQAAGSSVVVVLLNACYSEVQAQTLSAHIPCVIGMSLLTLFPNPICSYSITGASVTLLLEVYCSHVISTLCTDSSSTRLRMRLTIWSRRLFCDV